MGRAPRRPAGWFLALHAGHWALITPEIAGPSLEPEQGFQRLSFLIRLGVLVLHTAAVIEHPSHSFDLLSSPQMPLTTPAPASVLQHRIKRKSGKLCTSRDNVRDEPQGCSKREPKANYDQQ